MGDSRATFIRYVLPVESMEALVQEAKQLTWEQYREYAVFRLENGRRVLLQGSTFQVDLEQSMTNDPFGRMPNQLFVQIEGESNRIIELIFHTHPKPTGPSDNDLRILQILGQERSMLYELFGPFEGTEKRPKGQARPL